MIRSPRKTVANGLLIGALALLIPAVAGCQAGTDAPTLEFHQSAGGAYADVNHISISNAFVLGASSGSTVVPGADVSLFLSMYNSGTSGDKLVSASAAGWASSVQIAGGPVSIPANSPVHLTGPQPSIALIGLTKPLSGGEAIPVTLDFQQAGSVTLEVPVEPQAFYYSTFSPPPAVPPTTPAPGGTPTP